MKLAVYGNLETCSRCKYVHKKLEEKSIEFDFIDNEDTVREVGMKLGFMGIPFAIKDNEPMGTVQLIKYVNKL